MSRFCPPARQAAAPTLLAPRCAPQGPEGAGELGAEACAVHALFLILHSGNILDSGPGDANSKQADVQTLSLAFEAVTRVHFPEALGHVALRLVPCPPICAAAYALVSKYWSGVGGLEVHRVPRVHTSTWGLLGPGQPHGGMGGRPGSQTPGPVRHMARPQCLGTGSVTKASRVLALPTRAPQRWGLPASRGDLDGRGSGGAAGPHPPATPPPPA